MWVGLRSTRHYQGLLPVDVRVSVTASAVVKITVTGFSYGVAYLLLIQGEDWALGLGSKIRH